jgi:hypothetical protein
MSADQSLHYFFPEDSPNRIVKVSSRTLSAAVNFAEEEFCGRCPVRVVCLEKELAHGQEQYGVFAGTSPETRRALARTRTRAKCPECRQPSPARVITERDGQLLIHQACSACGLSWTAEPSLAAAS